MIDAVKHFAQINCRYRPLICEDRDGAVQGLLTGEGEEEGESHVPPLTGPKLFILLSQKGNAKTAPPLIGPKLLILLFQK